jgi:hypothetical protein
MYKGFPYIQIMVVYNYFYSHTSLQKHMFSFLKTTWRAIEPQFFIELCSK